MNLRPFELVLIIIFGLAAAGGLVVLATYNPSAPEPDDVTEIDQPVLIWGLLDQDAMDGVLEEIAVDNPAYEDVRYVQKDPRTFDLDLLTALAERDNPDLIVIPHDKLIEHRSKLFPIPYDQIPPRDYRDTYIDGASIFTLTDGIYALPLVVDPLVMYWNRDIFANFGFITPPRTWEQIINESVPTIVERDFNRRIIRSPIAFGTYTNVRNAHGVISTLLLQGGSRLVQQDVGGYKVALNDSRSDQVLNPFTDAMSFYTRFGSINNPLYSWNRTLPEDRQAFVAEDLALYFGYGSEARELEALNPNLAFDNAEVPNSEIATIRRTYGTFYGIGILKEANSLNDAYKVSQFLSAPTYTERLATELGMVPAQRALVEAGSDDVYGRVTYSAAEVSYGWLNPDKESLDDIMSSAINDIHANRRSVNSVTSDISQQIVQLLSE